MDDLSENADCTTAIDTPLIAEIVESNDSELAEFASNTRSDTPFGEILSLSNLTAAFM